MTTESRFDKPRYRMDVQLDLAAFQGWLSAATDAPDKNRDFALKMMGKAIREELSEKQMRYISGYYVDGMDMQEIAALHGVNKSTVSRTIKRARKKLRRVLRYSNPVFLRQDLEEGAQI